MLSRKLNMFCEIINVKHIPKPYPFNKNHMLYQWDSLWIAALSVIGIAYDMEKSYQNNDTFRRKKTFK